MAAFVRTEDSPRLPPPPSASGIWGWLRLNLFAGPGQTVLTLLFGATVLWFAWTVLKFAVLAGIWDGADRNACLASPTGACWPLVREKIGQWIYGFYPIDQRWRANVCFALLVAVGIPMLVPALPFKRVNALLLVTALPLSVVILLSGGNLAFGPGSYITVAVCLLLMTVAVPFASTGIEEVLRTNRLCVLATGIALAAGLCFAVLAATGSTMAVLGSVSGLIAVCVTVAVGALAMRRQMSSGQGFVLLAVSASVFAGMAALDYDFGLSTVDTAQWGGLLVTLIVAVVGIITSLPLGIVLALGRQSSMPLVRTLSVGFIEIVRGVPLITVLFMSSVMLPLFLPPGMSFDKLLRALIGVALFSSAYMAEVVRGGIQAIDRGQYEGATALGLRYWPMMIKIVLPQALKISIPNIVSNFISLFKDTTLVLIIGVFDLLGIVQTTLRDPKWATPTSAATGYLAVALMYWVFCFGMSRYAKYTERRLHRGHKR
ncbi:MULTISPECIES: amino acid ABC transporter permease [Rhizobium]|uniref:Amino acid ABC transporter permease n=1 Tax=Rhizobium fabae TaxID=573179 RepID=A0A7W6FI78_9HYPH|nr:MULTISPECIES: amino acid ABC transporter permease [Rhizobium]MBB3914539.1 general L-amino acid transport system permease protein [Rhizobium fabae]PDS66169.1 amino acid ABC transporter permease [Rhizobium anhuiense]RUM14543.1 amino acid ABC transporter permease [Rhizobium fabae]